MPKTVNFAQRWFASRGWKPFAFQKEVWGSVADGESGLLHASTGAGKTYSVWFGALNRFARTVPATTNDKPRKRKPAPAPLQVLWITPMRALAADTARALEAPLKDLDIAWSVGLRTGDTSSS
jgi:ATP-dependent Lhr-like helicase